LLEGESEIACAGVESREEFVGDGDANDFRRFSGGAEAFFEGDEVGFVTGDDGADDEEDIPERAAATADASFADCESGVACQWGESGEFGDGFVGQGAEFWQLGEEASDGSVGNAFDGAQGGVEAGPCGVVLDGCCDEQFEFGDLSVNDGDEFLEGCQDEGVGDEPGLVSLGGAEFGELAKTCNVSAESELRGGSGDGWFCFADQGVLGDDACVDGVGFFQLSHAEGELADGAWVEDGDLESLLGQAVEGFLFVSAGGFHGDERDLVGAAEGGQLQDTGDGIGELGAEVGVGDGDVEGARGNIDSTEGVCHGNLPCKCDWMSCDCSVVRDLGSGPWAEQRWVTTSG